MGFEIVKKSIFDIDAEVLINPVNCVGVSGAGLAKEFAKRFPRHQGQYEKIAESGLMIPGCPAMSDMFDGKMVVFFPTKGHYDNPSRYSYILKGLHILAKVNFNQAFSAGDRPVKTVAIPLLGCGLGGLMANRVEAMIVDHLGHNPFHDWVLALGES